MLSQSIVQTITTQVGQLALAAFSDAAAARAVASVAVRMMSAQRSPIMIVAALVLPEVTAGMPEASATRSPARRAPQGRSTTASRSTPVRQVPTWW